MLAWYILSGRNIARLRWSRLRWPLFRNILGVGAVAAVTSLQTNVIIALATALTAFTAGAGAAAGYGTGARLEYLLIPLVFSVPPLATVVEFSIRPSTYTEMTFPCRVAATWCQAPSTTSVVPSIVWSGLPTPNAKMRSSQPCLASHSKAWMAANRGTNWFPRGRTRGDPEIAPPLL